MNLSSFSFLPAPGPCHPFLKGMLKSIAWLFLVMQPVSSSAPCVLVGGGGGRGRAGRDALILQFPVSGGLGPEPWEAGGLNNENPRPRDLARPSPALLSFIHEALLL